MAVANLALEIVGFFYHAVRNTQSIEHWLGELLKHKKLRAGNAATIADVAAVGSHDQHRDAIQHTHLRQRPGSHQQPGDAGDEYTAAPAQRGAGAERDAVALTRDGDAG